MSKYTIGIDPYDKQETLEEAAEWLNKKFNGKGIEVKIINWNKNEVNNYPPSKLLEEYAKWQQERSYSEEDMMFAYEQGARLAFISQSPLALHKGEFPTPKEWFEQFKNK
jgi:hypothetical protein